MASEQANFGMKTALALLAFSVGCASMGGARQDADRTASVMAMGRIGIDAEGRGFVDKKTGAPFRVWGVNYDHDRDGRLLEDYWHDEWDTVVEDFREMRDLSANAVRIHLQYGKFFPESGAPDPAEMERLERLLRLAEETGLYLNLTGLACYHKADVPAWYDALEEQERWAAQVRFWEVVAEACADSPAVFCYDLMNEPVLGGDVAWLPGEGLGDKFFVQRIALDLGDRTRAEVARAWVDMLTAAIRRHDPDRLITVGVIPWAHVWPNARPVFYGEGVHENLDFVSVHFYPETGEVDKALTAMAVYDVGKPIVVEEMFPLKCGIADLNAFVDGSRDWVAGFFGFYWGATIEELGAVRDDMAAAITRAWLEYFRDKTSEMTAPRPLTGRQGAGE